MTKSSMQCVSGMFQNAVPSVITDGWRDEGITRFGGKDFITLINANTCRLSARYVSIHRGIIGRYFIVYLYVISEIVLGRPMRI